MVKKIEIKCSKAQFKRILESMESYYEDGRCVLGKTHETCPSVYVKNASCADCIRRNVVRVEI